MRLVVVGALLALVGCRGGTSTEPPVLPPPKIVDHDVVPVTNMNIQPKYKAQSGSNFWPDGSGSRVPPAGTVARDALKADSAFYRGVDEAGQPVQQYPVELSAELLDRGQERYDIYCAPCHDQAGSGRGLVTTRGWMAPPTFHQERIREMVPGELFHIVSHGVRTMPAYAKQIAESDRWAIVAYLQALQRSHFARLDEVPADQRTGIQ